MSDTPSTDGIRHNIAELGTFCRQLERELNAAQATIRQQQLLDEEILRLRERVKRLEEALGLVLKMRDDWLQMQEDGYAGAYYAFVKGNDSEWDVITKAKESKP